MDGMRLSALRLPRLFFVRVVVGMTRARRRAARTLTLIRPRVVQRSGGGGPRTCAVEGACSAEVYP